MADTIRMVALRDRAGKPGTARPPLTRGKEYNATPQQARDDERRGYGARVKPDEAKPAKAAK